MRASLVAGQRSWFCEIVTTRYDILLDAGILIQREKWVRNDLEAEFGRIRYSTVCVAPEFNAAGILPRG
jgi:hypothetical protein